MKSQKGFSLMEVLISVAILSAMSLLIYASTGQILDGKLKVEKKDAFIHSVRLSLSMMVSDLRQAVLYHKSMHGKENNFVSGFQGTDTRIDFSTLSHFHYIEDAKDTDQVTVAYWLEKEEEGDYYKLMRRESQRLGEKIDEGGKAYTLMNHVKELRFEYYDSNKEEWTQEWDTTKVSALGRMPQAVKIFITLIEENEEDGLEKRELDYSTIAPVALFENIITL